MIQMMNYKFVADGNEIYNSKSEWISEESLKSIRGALRLESFETRERYFSGDFLYFANIFDDKRGYLGMFFAKMDTKTNKLIYKPERYDINNLYNM